MSVYAPLAQLDRASVYGTEGYRFESCEVYFFALRLIARLFCFLQKPLFFKDLRNRLNAGLQSEIIQNPVLHVGNSVGISGHNFRTETNLTRPTGAFIFRL